MGFSFRQGGLMIDEFSFLYGGFTPTNCRAKHGRPIKCSCSLLGSWLESFSNNKLAYCTLLSSAASCDVLFYYSKILAEWPVTRT
jgi:hypothetical protein